ncbi:MAG: class I adenylate-forming enzyme family protein, partial [Candidatus Thiodiazotropha sp.]
MKPAPATLVDRFRESAASHADSLAIADSANRVSYRQLSELVDKVCSYLLSSGLQKGDRIAMVVANSAEYAGIFYGIWAAGGVTVALNTQAKARDILNWVGHSDARWLFIDRDHPEREAVAEAGSGFTLVDVGAGEADAVKDHGVSWQTLLECDAAVPKIELQRSDLASIIYTSGTTGHPKGVTLSHGNLCANIESILAYLELSAGDSILNVLPFYYSYGNSILHTHLTIGAALILENSLLYP